MNSVLLFVLVIVALVFGVVGLVMGSLAYVKAEDAESASSALDVPDSPHMLLQPKEDLSGLEWVSRPIVRGGHIPVVIKHVHPNEKLQDSDAVRTLQYTHTGDLKVDDPSQWFMHPGDRIHVRVRMDETAGAGPGDTKFALTMLHHEDGETKFPQNRYMFYVGNTTTNNYADPFIYEGDLIYEGATTNKAKVIGRIVGDHDPDPQPYNVVDRSLDPTDPLGTDYFDISKPFTFRFWGSETGLGAVAPIVREVQYSHHPAHEGATPMEFDYT